MIRQTIRTQRGFSLVEVVLVMTIIGFLLLLIANLPNSISVINKSRQVSIAQEIASSQMEYLRSLGYSNLYLTPDEGEIFVDVKLSHLPGSEARYLISECPDSVCVGSDELKEIKVLVTWINNSISQEVKIVTLVGSGGLNQ